MASATARPTFSFHISTSFSQPSPPKPKTHFSLLPKIPSFSLSLHHKPLNPSKFIPNSIDVSKEDKPTSDQPTSPSPPPAPAPPEEQEKFDKRRLEEKFAVLNTGIYECRSCGYKYDEAVGDPSYPIPPGLPFEKLPEDWRCPTCGASQGFFESKRVEIAGFAQNQQFGLGGNTLTSGQKAILIYGSLLFFFGLFLSGYFLQ
ncbi:Rubredoxin, iron-binding site [Trema orientale]|uniref:Rubredoxin, iron-binding site n=1 Tax=Trema orientale TaxID=63057 RepID=A0A2P5END7_TREOI|nr:Rubredoxin, iron-binding site [Trema orientale]